MVDVFAPYIYVIGMFPIVLWVGTVALMAGNAPEGNVRPTALALTGALLTWATLAFVIVNPLPIKWAQTAGLSMWTLLSILGAVLLWFCRPPKAPEPPAEPPTTPTYPKRNGQFMTPSSTDVDAEMLMRTYRKKST